MMLKMIRHFEASSTNNVFQVTILEALHMLQQSWMQVTQSAITNCFTKADFKHAVETVQVQYLSMP